MDKTSTGYLYASYPRFGAFGSYCGIVTSRADDGSGLVAIDGGSLASGHGYFVPDIFTDAAADTFPAGTRIQGHAGWMGDKFRIFTIEPEFPQENEVRTFTGTILYRDNHGYGIVYFDDTTMQPGCFTSDVLLHPVVKQACRSKRRVHGTAQRHGGGWRVLRLVPEGIEPNALTFGQKLKFRLGLLGYI